MHIIFGTECLTTYTVLTMVLLANFINVTKNSSLLYKHLNTPEHHLVFDYPVNILLCNNASRYIAQLVGCLHLN